MFDRRFTGIEWSNENFKKPKWDPLLKKFGEFNSTTGEFDAEAHGLLAKLKEHDIPTVSNIQKKAEYFIYFACNFFLLAWHCSLV